MQRITAEVVQFGVCKFVLLAGSTDVSEWPLEMDLQRQSKLQTAAATILTAT